MLAYVGLDARKDINWVAIPTAESMELFAEGKVDAFMGFPAGAAGAAGQEDRPTSSSTARWIGPGPSTSAAWSRPTGNSSASIRSPPSGRCARILKAADICALEPERAARYLVDKGFTPRYDIALQIAEGGSYGRWRDYDPEDTLRFYALRLHEVGMIKIEPAEDHRPGHGLAVFERAEEGAEGVRSCSWPVLSSAEGLVLVKNTIRNR